MTSMFLSRIALTTPFFTALQLRPRLLDIDVGTVK
jgi:hypothetical protein